MSVYSIDHGNISFVPIVRQRLNFAVLVQKAVREAQLQPGDVLAVELQPSAADGVRKAIAEFPNISILVASAAGVEEKEVIAVTPCDGVIEAVRIAAERHIDLHCLDQELTPSHFWRRHCFRDTNWPDDALVLERGAQAYFELVQERVSHFPARLDPVDCWRESHMAGRLRRLSPHCRRILFVCDIVHVAPLRTLLQTAETITEVDSPIPFPALEAWKPSLSVLLSYLDDIPCLVEAYEVDRADNSAADFNKHSALLKKIRSVQGNSGGLSFSTRRYKTFLQFLTNLLEYEGRLSAQLEDVLAAAGGCFGEQFKDELRLALLNYHGLINARRVGKSRALIEELRPLHGEGVERTQIFVARSCNPSRVIYELESEPITQLPVSPSTGERGNSAVWTGWTDLADEIRKTALQRSKRSARLSKSVKYSGSLQDGVDYRRTLRSQLSQTPTLYVKRKSLIPERRVDIDEPVVFLWNTRSRPRASFDVLAYASTLVVCWFWSPESELVHEDRVAGDQVWRKKLDGLLYFGDRVFTSEEQVRAVISRLPRMAGTNTENRGWIFNDFLAEFRCGRSWWELLVMAGIEYSRESVICVLPSDMRLTSSLIRYAIRKGKEIVTLAPSRFDQGDLEKLRSLHTVEANASVSLRTKLFVRAHFQEVMKKLWP